MEPMRCLRNCPLLVLVLFALGCGADSTERALVRGTVRHRGQRLTSGSIVFVPNLERGTPNEMAIGEIKPDGSYQLSGSVNSTGVAPGWYRITIATGSPSQSAFGFTLPDKYRDPLLSGLECEVQLGRENVIDFDLQ
jgi:hypothetical protein